MNKADRKRIADHLKKLLQLLEMSQMARDVTGYRERSKEQIETDIYKLEQWETNRQ